MASPDPGLSKESRLGTPRLISFGIITQAEATHCTLLSNQFCRKKRTSSSLSASFEKVINVWG